jgi:dihydrodipicolinate synthase/N-acetylneuraminate lyase
MEKSRLIEGIVPVVSTPFTKSGDIDEEGLKRLIKFLNSKSIGGLWVLGTGSEDMNLTFEKRLQVARITAAENNGKTPLVLGAGFFAMEDIENFIKETQNLNIDAYHVMPYHPLLSLNRLDWFYRYIADLCPKPLWMYTSANWCRPFTPAFVENLVDYPNIAGVKFSSSNSVDVFKVIDLAKEDFQIITAVAGQLFQCLSMGVKAHTSSLGSCIPEFLISVYDLFVQGKREEALLEQKRLVAFLKEFSTGPKKDNFLMAAEEKYLLSLRGICESFTSSYYRDTSTEEKERLRELVNRYQLFPLES